MTEPLHARIIFPNQLFLEHLEADEQTLMILVEDDLFFKQNPFHKQKIILHRASMRSFADKLTAHGFKVCVIDSSTDNSMDILRAKLTGLNIKNISYYDLVDDWLEQRVISLQEALSLQAERLTSPSFLTTLGMIDDYFDSNSHRMQHFYEWQRKRLNIMMDGVKPLGGRWSYDTANRRKLPKGTILPDHFVHADNDHVTHAKTWVNQQFARNPGNAASFNYAITHEQAQAQLTDFIHNRLVQFGPYEDAIAQDESQLFHSMLSPALNCGLLTPKQVIDQVLAYASNAEVPIESLEGFIRQIIGWREYMRATYVRYGRKMRTSNALGFSKKLNKSWWDGTVGIKPIDTTIQRVIETAYAHHIERLMILGNSMVLLRIDPDEAYTWFMSLFIDAYDWVMVPNVYAMSQFAAGEMITTKPYISGSNYITKMSDYKKEGWANIWDALYWRFIVDHQDLIKKNFRTRMAATEYDNFTDEKKQKIASLSQDWLE